MIHHKELDVLENLFIHNPEKLKRKLRLSKEMMPKLEQTCQEINMKREGMDNFETSRPLKFKV